MLLNIKEMEARKLKFAQSWQPSEFDFTDSGMNQSAPLIASGTAEMVPHTGGEIRVQGKVQTVLSTECDRCLIPASYPVDAEFDLYYKPATELADAGDELAINAGEAEIGFYELPGLELEDILREQVLLQIPMQRLCRPDCKGICPVCGANRNDVSCDCAVRPGDDRWAALQSVNIQRVS
ncbi:MAG: hypothetical protein JWN34_3605 [Bryobacterales bacterium]|nr:hypothetical protein [Bryobacterales bacterium]